MISSPTGPISSRIGELPIFKFLCLTVTRAFFAIFFPVTVYLISFSFLQLLTTKRNNKQQQQQIEPAQHRSEEELN